MKERYYVNFENDNVNDLAIDVAFAIAERANELYFADCDVDLDVLLYEEIESALIFDDDKWELLHYYCTPQNVSMFYAIDCLKDEINQVLYMEL